MAACQQGAATNGADTTKADQQADSLIEATGPELSSDTALPGPAGLPDTLTLNGQLYRVVPSTQELFASAKEFTPDTSEEKNIAQQKDRVRRHGDTLTMQLTNGQVKQLVNNLSDGEDLAHFTYQGYIPALKSYVVHLYGYEYFDVQVVNENTGELVQMINLPQVSPDGKQVIASNTDLMAAFTTNGLQCFNVTPKGLVLAYEYQPDRWGPERIKWLDEKVLVGIFSVTTKDMDVIEHYVRLEPVRK